MPSLIAVGFRASSYPSKYPRGMGVGKEYQKGIDLGKSFLPIKKIIPPSTQKSSAGGLGYAIYSGCRGCRGAWYQIPGRNSRIVSPKNNEILFIQYFTCSIKKSQIIVVVNIFRYGSLQQSPGFFPCSRAGDFSQFRIFPEIPDFFDPLFFSGSIPAGPLPLPALSGSFHRHPGSVAYLYMKTNIFFFHLLLYINILFYLFPHYNTKKYFSFFFLIFPGILEDKYKYILPAGYSFIFPRIPGYISFLTFQIIRF